MVGVARCRLEVGEELSLEPPKWDVVDGTCGGDARAARHIWGRLRGKINVKIASLRDK